MQFYVHVARERRGALSLSISDSSTDGASSHMAGADTSDLHTLGSTSCRSRSRLRLKLRGHAYEAK